MENETKVKSPWMNKGQVAEYVGVHPDTIERWRRTLDFPFDKPSPGVVRYHRDQVDEWMRSRVNPDSE